MSARSPINCPICGKLITQKKNLQSHINRLHNQEYIEQKLTKKEQKIMNIRIKFKCPYCDLTFTRDYNKQRHQKRHEQQTPSLEPTIETDTTLWFKTPIDIDLINDFIENELSEFLTTKEKSSYALQTNKLNKNDIKYINNWKDFELQIQQALAQSINWSTFLEELKISLIHIDGQLYGELFSHLEKDEFYKLLIPLFNRIKVWLQSIKSGLWNHQNIGKLITKMEKF